MIGGKERKVSPKDVDDWTGVESAGGGICKGKMGVDRRKDGELNYQERVAMIRIEKLKSKGACTLNGVEG